VIGIWKGTMDGSDVNSVDVLFSKNLLATADDFGKISLFYYPAAVDGGSVCTQYSGFFMLFFNLLNFYYYLIYLFIFSCFIFYLFFLFAYIFY
jgi:hypothetical protein